MTERNRWIEACSALEIDLDAEVERTLDRVNAITDAETDEYVAMSLYVSLDELRTVVNTITVFRKLESIALSHMLNSHFDAGIMTIAAASSGLASALQTFVVDMAEEKGLVAPLEEVNRG